MEKNVGGIDRYVRLVLGPLLVLAGVASLAGLLSLAVGPLSAGVAAGLALVVGAVFAVTGAIQWCPIHSLLGFNTCPA